VKVEEKRIEGIAFSMPVTAVVLNPLVDAEQEFLLKQTRIQFRRDAAVQTVLEPQRLLVFSQSRQQTPPETHS